MLKKFPTDYGRYFQLYVVYYSFLFLINKQISGLKVLINFFLNFNIYI